MDNPQLTTLLHEISFPITVAATANVNSIEPALVMAWLLHKAQLAGDRDRSNRNRFLAAASELAQVYGYMPMAARVRKTLEAIP